jgi:ribosomal protein S18 acetylase RimI-like enzyme
VTLRIRQASTGDLPVAARTLALAFADYSWTRWTIPADDYAARLEELQALYLGHAVEHGLVFVDDDVRGVAAFLPPGAPPPADHVQARVGALHGDRVEALLAGALPPHPTPSWEFATLGVRPDARGSGLGAALIDAAVAEITARDPGGVIALETSDDRNVRLYERHGFSVTARSSVVDAPPGYAMARVLPTRADG